MEFKKLKIEKFTIARYERYKKKGIDFRMFTQNGNECDKVTIDGDDILINVPRYIEYSKKWVDDKYIADKNGSFGCRGRLYIVQGLDDIDAGDIIIQKNSKESGFFFYRLFTGICQLDGKIGFGTHWDCDCFGGQIGLCHLFHNASDDYYVRRATDEEISTFYQHLLDGGYAHDEENLCLYCVPKVGQEYWTIDPDENGLMVVNHHEAPKDESERTFGKRNVFKHKSKAEERAEKINSIMILGKLKEY